jgi:flavin-dependent dehydrogenase
VGDAALSLDPLSSQGLLNAITTGLACGRAVHAGLAGDSEAMSGYVNGLASVYAQYLENRTTYYALEGRWVGRPFWRRRSRVSG